MKNIHKMSYSLTLNNKKVVDFYREHKNINFESMNILFVEILDNLLRNTNPTLDANTAASLLTSVKVLQNQVSSSRICKESE